MECNSLSCFLLIVFVMRAESTIPLEPIQSPRHLHGESERELNSSETKTSSIPNQQFLPTEDPVLYNKQLHKLPTDKSTVLPQTESETSNQPKANQKGINSNKSATYPINVLEDKENSLENELMPKSLDIQNPFIIKGKSYNNNGNQFKNPYKMSSGRKWAYPFIRTNAHTSNLPTFQEVPKYMDHLLKLFTNATENGTPSKSLQTKSNCNEECNGSVKPQQSLLNLLLAYPEIFNQISDSNDCENSCRQQKLKSWIDAISFIPNLHLPISQLLPSITDPTYQIHIPNYKPKEYEKMHLNLPVDKSREFHFPINIARKSNNYNQWLDGQLSIPNVLSDLLIKDNTNPYKDHLLESPVLNTVTSPIILKLINQYLVPESTNPNLNLTDIFSNLNNIKHNLIRDKNYVNSSPKDQPWKILFNLITNDQPDSKIQSLLEVNKLIPPNNIPFDQGQIQSLLLKLLHESSTNNMPSNILYLLTNMLKKSNLFSKDDAQNSYILPANIFNALITVFLKLVEDKYNLQNMLKHEIPRSSEKLINNDILSTFESIPLLKYNVLPHTIQLQTPQVLPIRQARYLDEQTTSTYGLVPDNNLKLNLTSSNEDMIRQLLINQVDKYSPSRLIHYINKIKEQNNSKYLQQPLIKLISKQILSKDEDEIEHQFTNKIHKYSPSQLTDLFKQFQK